jgi:hypothetical protein
MPADRFMALEQLVKMRQRSRRLRFLGFVDRVRNESVKANDGFFKYWWKVLGKGVPGSDCQLQFFQIFHKDANTAMRRVCAPQITKYSFYLALL